MAAVQTKLTELELQAAKGHQIRAQAKWDQDGDRPSSFFFQKIQKRKRKISIEGLFDGQRILRSTPGELQKIIMEAFKSVFSSTGPPPPPGWSAKWARVLCKIHPKVSAAQKELLDHPLSPEELVEALASMPGGKSPGRDGLSKEFFVLYWPELKGLVWDAVQDACASGSLGLAFNEGIVCLCPKTGDLRVVDQWRPITLLTTFYKIVAKALALKLQPLMDGWLEPEQRGFAKGRSIVDNLLLYKEAK